MKIYTKTGDDGETSLYRGGRIAKDSSRLEAYGTLDELNSLLGLALALMPADPSIESARAELGEIQRDLFRAGAHLATVGAEPPPSPSRGGGVAPTDPAGFPRHDVSLRCQPHPAGAPQGAVHRARLGRSDGRRGR